MRHLVTAFLILFIACKPQQNVEYNLPSDLNEFDKKYVLEDLETGRILYKDHCSNCHGIFGKAIPDAPDFAVVELKYNLEKTMRRAITRDPISHEVTFKMMQEEVNQTLGFIQRFKRKQN